VNELALGHCKLLIATVLRFTDDVLEHHGGVGVEAFATLDGGDGSSRGDPCAEQLMVAPATTSQMNCIKGRDYPHRCDAEP
jgi:hypothetical protein